jgi:hypothetical protein
MRLFIFKNQGNKLNNSFPISTEIGDRNAPILRYRFLIIDF